MKNRPVLVTIKEGMPISPRIRLQLGLLIPKSEKAITTAGEAALEFNDVCRVKLFDAGIVKLVRIRGSEATLKDDGEYIRATLSGFEVVNPAADSQAANESSPPRSPSQT